MTTRWRLTSVTFSSDGLSSACAFSSASAAARYSCSLALAFARFCKRQRKKWGKAGEAESSSSLDYCCTNDLDRENWGTFFPYLFRLDFIAGGLFCIVLRQRVRQRAASREKGKKSPERVAMFSSTSAEGGERQTRRIQLRRQTGG